MKRVLIEMINDEITGGSNAEIGLKLGDLITQSLRWWQSHLGDKDRIGPGQWRVESIEVKEIPAPK
ncbi:MAG: hypothetical protein GTO40_16020 [Deltaproteobacteria bacterium]|nr:hypothetical protein [Deltaproteobacteria bacterium]